eukprot:scaffold964_cov261-Pinguiococcus_pyrenoidosus.AAC.1
MRSRHVEGHRREHAHRGRELLGLGRLRLVKHRVVQLIRVLQLLAQDRLALVQLGLRVDLHVPNEDDALRDVQERRGLALALLEFHHGLVQALQRHDAAGIVYVWVLQALSRRAVSRQRAEVQRLELAVSRQHALHDDLAGPLGGGARRVRGREALRLPLQRLVIPPRRVLAKLPDEREADMRLAASAEEGAMLRLAQGQLVPCLRQSCAKVLGQVLGRHAALARHFSRLLEDPRGAPEHGVGAVDTVRGERLGRGLGEKSLRSGEEHAGLLQHRVGDREVVSCKRGEEA